MTRRHSQGQHRFLSEEFLHARTWPTEGQRRKALAGWNNHYNYHRQHSASDCEPLAFPPQEGASKPIGILSLTVLAYIAQPVT